MNTREKMRKLADKFFGDEEFAESQEKKRRDAMTLTNNHGPSYRCQTCGFQAKDWTEAAQHIKAYAHRRWTMLALTNGNRRADG